jgi:hypothetical protein
MQSREAQVDQPRISNKRPHVKIEHGHGDDA